MRTIASLLLYCGDCANIRNQESVTGGFHTAASQGIGPADDVLMYVAVGASAGGLAPLRELLATANVNDQLAFIVITHLPMHHVSHLAELLALVAPIPASEAKRASTSKAGISM